jgi:hypothetical protein
MSAWTQLFGPTPSSVVTDSKLPRNYAGLEHLTYGDGMWATSVPVAGGNVKLCVPGTESGISEAFASRAVRVLKELEKLEHEACSFLAGYPGFGGIDRIRQVFTLTEVVLAWPHVLGGFWMEFSCLEDCEPGAIWRVEFANWIPLSHSRDS